MRGFVRLGVLFGSLLATSASSAGDAVTFDTRKIFSCAEVKPPQQADAARKVVLIVIPISANFEVEEKTVESLRYELRMPESVNVLDHLPKTQTGTDVVGAQREQRQEHQLTDLNVKFGGEGKVNFSAYGVEVNLGGGAERSKCDLNEVKTNIQVDRLPARDQIVVVGTRDEGQTLWFDLKWHSQTTRAGQTDYALLAEVPKDWTGDVATLACAARQNGAVAGRMTKVVGLYLSGDNAARLRVEKELKTAQPTAVSEDKEVIVNSIGIKLKLIPAGSLLMGATPDDTNAQKDEKPQHKVTITKPFYIGVYEVTQYEYRQVMNANPSHFKDSELLPVETVSFINAVTFCNKLSEREKFKPYYKIEGDEVTILGGNGYRLPTEAEWEYASGGGDADLENYAWFGKNSGDKTHPVGKKQPNRWGLYDMQGNVWEWCQDWYSAEYYNVSPENDPPGPATGSLRVDRGGAWSRAAERCRAACRDWNTPSNSCNYLGLRVARVPD